ncbi:MAG: hypothetical protein H7Z16_07855 [Pyrinomonadaceae bacterium]|nr:hypothetical protein [Pyrinomonadaceae bacterium]
MAVVIAAIIANSGSSRQSAVGSRQSAVGSRQSAVGSRQSAGMKRNSIAKDSYFDRWDPCRLLLPTADLFLCLNLNPPTPLETQKRTVISILKGFQ